MNYTGNDLGPQALTLRAHTGDCTTTTHAMLDYSTGGETYGFDDAFPALHQHLTRAMTDLRAARNTPETWITITYGWHPYPVAEEGGSAWTLTARRAQRLDQATAHDRRPGLTHIPLAHDPTAAAARFAAGDRRGHPAPNQLPVAGQSRIPTLPYSLDPALPEALLSPDNRATLSATGLFLVGPGDESALDRTAN
ncbi:hypothetical protein ABT160_45485 [Streptomyces sp. NPDC001941]|uniref:hypothetical protein n=1 Tax=Streptomyces sp. NPDC001941 TaxID=3154659 RepID=UPI003319E665